MQSFEKPKVTSQGKSHLIAMALSTFVTLTAVVLLIHRTMAAPGGVSDERYRQAELFCQVFERLAQEYVTEVDDWELLYRGLEGMVSSLDPYCRFYDPVSNKKFDEATSGEYMGVGMVIYSKAEPVTVLYAFPGSPANNAHLKPGDRIISVGGISVTGLSVDEAQEHIKGKPGTSVELEVVRASDGSTFKVEVNRESIAQPSVVGASIIDSNLHVGYLHVSAFQNHTDEGFVAALRKLEAEGCQSLIIDVRFNSGGLLDQAVSMANRFIESGVLVSLEGRIAESNSVHRAEKGLFLGLDWDLIILTDERTASAAEVFAGALQDHKKALLMGTRTYGKGVVQSVVTMQSGQDREVSVKFTTAQYVTPGGQRIERSVGRKEEQRGGLEPDLPLPALDENQLQMTYEFLTQMEYPEDLRSEISKLIERPRLDPRDDPYIMSAIEVFSGKPFLRSVPEPEASSTR